MIRCDSVILDIDGTIWDTTGIVAAAWNRAISLRFPQVALVSADILKSQFGRPMNVIADSLFGPLSDEEKRVLMEDCCREEQAAILQNTENITYPGVVQTIKEISAKIPVFIVSNCQSGYIELVIQKNGLQGFITDFECYGRTGKAKDQNLRLVAERNRLTAPVYVGDTQGDADACKKAEIPFVWAAYGFGTADSFAAKIGSFAQLKSVLDGI